MKKYRMYKLSTYISLSLALCLCIVNAAGQPVNWNVINSTGSPIYVMITAYYQNYTRDGTEIFSGGSVRAIIDNGNPSYSSTTNYSLPDYRTIGFGSIDYDNYWQGAVEIQKRKKNGELDNDWYIFLGKRCNIHSEDINGTVSLKVKNSDQVRGNYIVEIDMPASSDCTAGLEKTSKDRAEAIFGKFKGEF